jgi:hypothetical protein
MSNNKQQTVSEWQYIEMAKWFKGLSEYEDSKDILDKAKEMEKQRIAKAFTDGKAQNFSFYDKTGEQYYEQTYGGGNK